MNLFTLNVNMQFHPIRHHSNSRSVGEDGLVVTSLGVGNAIQS